MNLHMVGCSHHRSGVALRERLAFTPAQAADALTAWHRHHPGVEAVLLSTCNRVEFYAASTEETQDNHGLVLAEHLAHWHQLSLDDIASQLVTLDGEAVVNHLFRVAASLDSMVVGEPQILAQVKEAYELACRLGSARAHMHGCFQAALRVARRVASETSLHRHRVSVPSVAIADFAREFFEQFDDKRVLVIGAGEMAAETLQYLKEAGAQKFIVLNRDTSRGQALAEEWRGTYAPWEELERQLVKADMVVSTTAASEPIVRHEMFRQRVVPARSQRSLFILDLAMPRDFEPAIGEELGVFLYSIDDLSAVCQRNRKFRQDELPKAERIVAEEAVRFLGEVRHRVTIPVIAQLREEFDVVKQAELQRLLNKLPALDPEHRREIEYFADRLVNKLLHPPLQSLREEAHDDAGQGLLDALRRLFRLGD
jgi:glutamyl-tRNA reductase